MSAKQKARLDALLLDDAFRTRLEAKMEALVKAARASFGDLDAGRYRDVADDAVEGVIGELGRQAGKRVRHAKG